MPVKRHQFRMFRLYGMSSTTSRTNVMLASSEWVITCVCKEKESLLGNNADSDPELTDHEAGIESENDGSSTDK